VTAYLQENRDALTAIVCYNDEVGLEVVHACRQLGISIPDELSIIGQDNSYIAKNANIRLTTLTHPQEQMGRDAADWVIRKLQGKKDLPNQTYYQPELVEGETVKEMEIE
jgi:GntR family transcriptional regulator of arabinose operon